MLRVRDIKTKVVDGKIVPELDANGQEVELWTVDVPADVEAAGDAAVEAYVARTLRERAAQAVAADAQPPAAADATVANPEE